MSFAEIKTFRPARGALWPLLLFFGLCSCGMKMTEVARIEVKENPSLASCELGESGLNKALNINAGLDSLGQLEKGSGLTVKLTAVNIGAKEMAIILRPGETADFRVIKLPPGASTEVFSGTLAKLLDITGRVVGLEFKGHSKIRLDWKFEHAGRLEHPLKLQINAITVYTSV